MIAIRVKIIDYDQGANTCVAQLLNGDVFELDPFVGCAIEMSDDEYESGKGFELVGKDYILTEYTVYKDNVVPIEGGMISL